MLTAWVPRTKAGKLVQAQEITSLDQVFKMNIPVMEPEIVDYLMPNISEEVLNVAAVQRTTDAGRKRQFQVTAVVGNKDGFVGVGVGKGPNVKQAIENSMRKARLNITPIQRGCGSWQCGCGSEHSVPFKCVGKCGSVRIYLMPAPKGTGIMAGDTTKKVLELAGVRDVWTRSSGNTRTVFNAARATVEALKNTKELKTGEVI
ncbi:MAG: 30S ribosomal protein S5 [Candidatus Diapherotrites archaeon]|nr:30S ribosomal protein S5 [Candidatus Diapherotrites archaeon]